MSLVRPLPSLRGLSARTPVSRVLLLCGLASFACTAPAPSEDRPAPEPQAAKTAPTPAPVVAPPTPPTPPTPEVAPPPAPPTTIGVAVCDDYVDRYRACIRDLAPAIEKDRHDKVVTAQRDNWLAAAADPKLAPGLADECSAAFDAARAATRIWGCVWRPDDKPEPERFPGGEPKPRSKGRGLADPLEGL